MVPPLVAAAVKVTEVPAQIVVPGLVLMLTDGVSSGFTVIVTLLLVTLVGEAQLATLVKTHVTTAPLARVDDEYVAAFVPTFVPFTFHW